MTNHTTLRAPVSLPRTSKARHACIVPLLAGLALLVSSSIAPAQVTFQQNANGQTFPCPSGSNYAWPNNNNWSQQQQIGKPCSDGADRVVAPSNWTTLTYPNGTGVDVAIPALPVRLDLGITVGTLQIASGGSLFMDRSSLTVANGLLANNGSITAKNNLGAAILTFSANATMSGSGELILFNNGAADAGARLATSNGATLTQAAGHKIRGVGFIDARMINNGVVSSDAAVGGGNLNSLEISAVEITNNGTFMATDGHTLSLTGTAVTQTPGGHFLADNGTVSFNSLASITGGTLAAANGGTFQGNGVILTNLTNNAPMAVANYRTHGSIVNNSTISVLGNPYHGAITCATDTTVSGAGKIKLTQGAYSFIDAAPGATLTQAAGHTIEGQGEITAPLVNNGLIISSISNGSIALTVGGKTNNGLIEAAPGSSLAINGIEVTQGEAGRISAAAGTVHLNSVNGVLATVTGGTLESKDGGFISAGVARFNNVTNNAAVKVNYAAIGAGTLVNNGEISIFGNPHLGQLEFTGNTTVSGAGRIASVQSGYSLMKIAPGFTLTNAAGHTISGNGNIRGTISNQGIIAPTAGSNLQLLSDEGGSNLVNDGGSVQLPANSTITLQSGVPFTQNSGEIFFQDGTLNTPSGVDLNGGTLVGSGTINGTIRNNGGTIAPGFSPGKITINGNYTQGAAGVLNIEIGGNTPGTGYDQLRVAGTATLGGTLNLKLIDGFQPQKGDVFEIIDPNAVSCAFAQINAEGFNVQANYAAGAITITVTDPPDRLLNISTRLRVGTGENALIGGFIITGAEAKKVIIRAIGPSLTSQGVGGVLENPTLELFDAAGESIAFNDNWRDDQEGEIQDSTIPPSNDLESAIVRTLQPGNYTAVVRGDNGGSGIGLVEVYDLAGAAQSKLSNISSRGFVEAGQNVMIGGFIVGGGGAGTRVVVRAIGPSLSAGGVEGALQDPTLQLVNANGSEIRANDNWQDGQRTDLEALSIQPGNELESALIETLSGGNYTAIVRGNAQSTGVGLVEVYNLD